MLKTTYKTRNARRKADETHRRNVLKTLQFAERYHSTGSLSGLCEFINDQIGADSTKPEATETQRSSLLASQCLYWDSKI